MIEFRGWPKIARLYRDIIVTEKIDGTNAAIGIQQFPFGWHVGGNCQGSCGTPGSHDHNIPQNAKFILGDGEDGLPTSEFLVYAQSRSRVITPGNDNHGFAGWVHENAQALVSVLGVGLHFGEWWGSGINRGYGLQKGEKRFSLFNTSRWTAEILDQANDWAPGLRVVPVLYQGDFTTLAVHYSMETLRLGGSVAAPQYMCPEGVVVFHTASNVMFKATLEDDEVPKNVVAMSRKPSAATMRMPLGLAA